MYQWRSLYIAISDCGKIGKNLSNYQMVSGVANATAVLGYLKDKRYSYLPGAHSNNSESSVSAVHDKATHERFEEKMEHVAVRKDDK